MPQINYPFSYSAEAFQTFTVTLGLLTLVSLYLLPLLMEAHAAGMTSASGTKSPLEGFSVPIGLNSSPLSYIGGLAQLAVPNMVGVYSVLSLVALCMWVVGSQSGGLLVPRASGVLILQTVFDTTRVIVGPSAGVLGWYGSVVTMLTMLASVNLMGNIPGGYTLTTSVAVAAGLSIGIWLWVLSESLSNQGVKFWASFIPSGTPLLLVPVLAPIELVSYTARAFSLGVRLFANMLAGHTLLAILANFMLAGLNASLLVALASSTMLVLYTALILLEVAVSLIQAYVFSVLTVSYLEGATG